MNQITYIDFDLLIEASEDKYKARVLNSPCGEATAEFALPFTDLELENFYLRMNQSQLRSRRLESPQMAAAKNLGAQLFETVFKDDIKTCLQGSIDEAADQAAGLRIRLRLSDVPGLANLPWEYLYNQTLNRFLCLSSETPIVRYLELPERIPHLAVKLPLKILVMISSPNDFPGLDVEQEWQQLKDAIKDIEQKGLVRLERLDQASVPALQRKLRTETFHIFHFIGHGGFDQQNDDGLLIFEDEREKSCPISGQYLGTILHDHRTLRMAFLNACEGARTSLNDPFAGVAQSLVQQGIPVVIAMQFEVTDATAITLAHEFYGAISDGYPVDAALAEARKAVFTQRNQTEWGTPVLYMRSPDGYIFDLKKVTIELPTTFPPGAIDGEAGQAVPQVSTEKYVSQQHPSQLLKQLISIARIILIVFMLSIPIYLSLNRQHLTGEITFTATDLALQLKYSEADKVTGKKIEILKREFLNTSYLSLCDFKPFSFKIKSGNGHDLSDIEVKPILNDETDLELISQSGLFSINSIEFEGSTVLKISSGDLFTSLDFTPIATTDNDWHVYATANLPDTFNVITETCQLSSLSSHQPGHFINTNKLISPAGATVHIANQDDVLHISLDHSRLQNRIMLANLDIDYFEAIRLDRDRNIDVSAIIDGEYKFFSLNEISGKITNESVIRFKTDSMKLVKLALHDHGISAQFCGDFSSIKIGKMGNDKEILPTYLARFFENRIAYFISIIYINILVTLLIGKRALKRISELFQFLR